MLKKIGIHNFKCFNEFEMDNIAPITIIGGSNNVGKTAFLEAIMTHYSAGNPRIFWSLGNMRNIYLSNPSPRQIWAPLFYNESNELTIISNDGKNDDSKTTFSKAFDTAIGNLPDEQKYELHNGKAEFSSIDANFVNDKYIISGKYILQKNMLSNATISFQKSAIPIKDLESREDCSLEDYAKSFEKMISYHNLYDANTPERLSKVTLNNEKKNLLINVLNIFDNNIVDITTVLDNGNAYIYTIMKSGRYIPINYMGDGIVKAIHILLYILDLQGGILLIDEMENGFYYGLYEKLLQSFVEAAFKMNCQLIMTTHNINIIETTMKKMDEVGRLDDLCYQRIDISNKANRRKARLFSGKSLVTAFANHMEIR